MTRYLYSIVRRAPPNTTIAVSSSCCVLTLRSRANTVVASCFHHLVGRCHSSAVPRTANATAATARSSSTLTECAADSMASAEGSSDGAVSPKPKPTPTPTRAALRPSASVVLLSATNEVLLLQRVKTSTSFALAQVFPGGNVDAFHDGAELKQDGGGGGIHRDGPAYRLCAVRETFEESGILLAKREGQLVRLSEPEREEARRRIHGGEVKFGDWLKSIGATPDTDSLIPFTRWLTPANMSKRFTTQMYLYFLPLTRRDVPTEMVVPTTDGGIEHTTAVFATPQTWIRRAGDGEIVLFPPQHYLLDVIGRYVGGGEGDGDGDGDGDGGEVGSVEEESRRFMLERRRLLRFVRQMPTATTALGRRHPSALIAWADKVISLIPLYARRGQGDPRVVFSLSYPGPELEGSGRAGDFERVFLATVSKKGFLDVEIRLRQEVLEDDGQLENERMKKL